MENDYLSRDPDAPREDLPPDALERVVEAMLDIASRPGTSHLVHAAIAEMAEAGLSGPLRARCAALLNAGTFLSNADTPPVEQPRTTITLQRTPDGLVHMRRQCRGTWKETEEDVYAFARSILREIGRRKTCPMRVADPKKEERAGNGPESAAESAANRPELAGDSPVSGSTITAWPDWHASRPYRRTGTAQALAPDLPAKPAQSTPAPDPRPAPPAGFWSGFLARFQGAAP